MRAFLRRAGAFYAKHAIGIDLVLITAGAAAVKRRLEDVHERLDALEEQGWVPIDDVVTLRDLAKLEGPLKAHQEALVDAGLMDDVPAPQVDLEPPPAPVEAVEAAVGQERPQEGTEAP